MDDRSAGSPAAIRPSRPNQQPYVKQQPHEPYHEPSALWMRFMKRRPAWIARDTSSARWSGNASAALTNALSDAHVHSTYEMSIMMSPNTCSE